MNNLFLKIEDFFLIKKEVFTWNICRFICIFITFFLLILYYNNLHLNYTFSYYILFNLGIILCAFIFFPKQLIFEFIIGCFYRVLNINILIFITFLVMIIFNYHSLTTQELLFFSKFVWTSILSCLFIKNLIYMKINPQNLICLFIVLSFLSLLSYGSLLVLQGFIYVFIDMDNFIIKINGEPSGQNNTNPGYYFNNGPNTPKPNTNDLTSFLNNNSIERSEDPVGMVIKKKTQLDFQRLYNEKDSLYREEYYKKYEVLSNKESNIKPYKVIYIKNLASLFTNVSKDICIKMFDLKVERDSLSIDTKIALEYHKSIIKNESKLYNTNLEDSNSLQKIKEENWSKYLRLNEKLAQKDKDLRFIFKAFNIPEHNVTIEKF